MSRTAQPELSLLRHKEKFFKVSEDERKVREEHKKLLALYIDECIKNGFKEVIYDVPPTITGPYCNYNVYEMSLFLARYCRSVGYEVKFYGVDRPTTLRISGWHSAEWLENNRPPDQRTRAMSVPTSAAKNPVFNGRKPVTKAKSITPEQASVIAQQGDLTRRLKAQLGNARRGI